MPVETAVYISDLVPANPPSTDAVAQGDDHLRLIKATLQNTFPNVKGAVTASHSDLNTVTGLVSGGNVTASGGKITLGTGTPVTLTNSGGTLTVASSGITVATLGPSGNLTIPGSLNCASVLQGGVPLIPRGVIVMWSGAIASVPAGWALCNGAQGTPNLTDRFIVAAGNAYVPAQVGGAGSATVTSTATGAHVHGGATGNAGNHSHTGSTDAQGVHSHGGVTGGHAITVAEMPSHNHTFPSVADGGSGTSPGGRAGPVAQSWTTDYSGGNAAHNHGIAADGNHAHNLSINGVGDHAHTVASDGTHTHAVTVATMPPYYALAYIMKL